MPDTVLNFSHHRNTVREVLLSPFHKNGNKHSTILYLSKWHCFSPEYPIQRPKKNPVLLISPPSFSVKHQILLVLLFEFLWLYLLLSNTSFPESVPLSYLIILLCCIKPVSDSPHMATSAGHERHPPTFMGCPLHDISSSSPTISLLSLRIFQTSL